MIWCKEEEKKIRLNIISGFYNVSRIKKNWRSRILHQLNHMWTQIDRAIGQSTNSRVAVYTQHILLYAIVSIGFFFFFFWNLNFPIFIDPRVYKLSRQREVSTYYWRNNLQRNCWKTINYIKTLKSETKKIECLILCVYVTIIVLSV